MRYGLSDEVHDLIKNIVNNYLDFKFILYGSRARGDYKSTSDIDICIKGNISEKDKFNILNEFDLLNIPYMFDIVFYNELTKKELIESIDREGVIYE